MRLTATGRLGVGSITVPSKFTVQAANSSVIENTVSFQSYDNYNRFVL